MSATIEDDVTIDASAGPVPLDGIAYGIDWLDAILVFHLGDAHLHAAWVRADAGFRAEEIVGSLRDAYRVSQFAARRLSLLAAGERRGEAQNPLLTIELSGRVALLRRVRAYVVATVFESALPLGMARLVATRLASQLEPELPREADGHKAETPTTSHDDGGAHHHSAVRHPTVSHEAGAALQAAARLQASRSDATAGGQHASATSTADHEEPAPATMAFGRRPSRPPMPRVTLTELDRTRRLLYFLEAHAPEPHTLRLRIALRTGLTPLALEHPETLGAEAVVLIETAVEDILGIDRAELRSIV